MAGNTGKLKCSYVDIMLERWQALAAVWKIIIHFLELRAIVIAACSGANNEFDHSQCFMLYAIMARSSLQELIVLIEVALQYTMVPGYNAASVPGCHHCPVRHGVTVLGRAPGHQTTAVPWWLLSWCQGAVPKQVAGHKGAIVAPWCQARRCQGT